MTEFENQSQTIIAKSEIKSKKSKKKIIIISAVVSVILAIAAVVTVMIVTHKEDYEIVIDEYFEALNNKDVDAMKKIKPLHTNEITNSSFEILYELMEENVGGNISFSYKIKDAVEIDTWDIERINAVENAKIDSKHQEITAAFTVTIDIIVEGDEDTMVMEDEELTIAKQNEKWKLYKGSML